METLRCGMSGKNMESKFSYQFTKRAEADLDDIVGYMSVELSNAQAAARFIEKLQAALDEIRSFPESGTLVINDFLQVKNVRKVIIGHYIMYYISEPHEKVISILRIVYGRRDINKIIRNLT